MQRDLISSLEAWKTKPKRKPLLLKGARQVGKTYLLKQFGASSFARCHYINFETDLHLHTVFAKNLDPKRIIKELSFALEQDIDIDNDFVIFDEIQTCPAALTSLKYFNEDLNGLALAAAGSLLGVHMSEGSFPVGMVDTLKLHPLSFTEFLLALKQKQLLDLFANHNWQQALPDIAHQKCLELWKLYNVTGGMPEVIALYCDKQATPVEAMQQVRIKQNELIHAYNSDIAKHAGKANAMHVARTWEQAAIQLANTQNESAARFHFKDIIPGIDRYQRLANAIDWLTAADLILKTPIIKTAELPLKAHTKESCFTLFYLDIGLLSSRIDIPPISILQNTLGGYKDYLAENAVAQALFSTDTHEMLSLYSWHQNKAEVEFCQTTDFGVIPIEVKAGNVTRAKSLDKFCDRYQPAFSVVLSANNIAHDPDNKRLYFPLYLASLMPWLKAGAALN